MMEATLRGHWVTLEPLTAANAREAAGLDRARATSPNLGGMPGRRDVPKSFAPPMLVRDNTGGSAIGVCENGEMTGYQGVAVVLIYIDESIGRPGHGMEAMAHYITEVFARGARLVHIEVIEFNAPMLRIMQKVRVEPQARLRDQVYVAGRFWDVLAYSFDQRHWEGVVRARYLTLFPGSSRAPAALGGRATTTG